jgi:hypothetical protein
MISAMMPDEAEGMPQADFVELRAAAGEVTAELMPHIYDAVAPIYADIFTAEELRAMLAFYDSEIGRSIMRKTIEATPALEEAMQAALPALTDDLVEALCARLECTPAEKRDMRERIRPTFM